MFYQLLLFFGKTYYTIKMTIRQDPPICFAKPGPNLAKHIPTPHVDNLYTMFNKSLTNVSHAFHKRFTSPPSFSEQNFTARKHNFTAKNETASVSRAQCRFPKTIDDRSNL